MRLEWISSMGFPFVQHTYRAHEVCPGGGRKSMEVLNRRTGFNQN
jgi:hypothetical protein